MNVGDLAKQELSLICNILLNFRLKKSQQKMIEKISEFVPRASSLVMGYWMIFHNDIELSLMSLNNYAICIDYLSVIM